MECIIATDHIPTKISYWIKHLVINLNMVSLTGYSTVQASCIFKPNYTSYELRPMNSITMSQTNKKMKMKVG